MCKKDLLEWIHFFQESEDNRALLKIKNSELYNTCNAHLAGGNTDIENFEETKSSAEKARKRAKERMVKFREKQGPEGREMNQVKAKLGMAKLRNQEAQHDLDIDKEKLKERMAELRRRQTPEEKEIAKEEARIGMIESRKNQVEEIKEYQRIMKKYKTRESIRSMSKEILSERKVQAGNAFAKKGGEIKEGKTENTKKHGYAY